jgi:uncharacterized protein (TIGR03790 family)
MPGWGTIRLLAVGLGLAQFCAAAADPRSVLILVNDLVPPEDGTGSTGASVYVGQYYATRRGIPFSNIVHLSVPLACCNRDPHEWDSWNTGWQKFEDTIRTPVKGFLETNGLKYTIKYIVPTYGVPVRMMLGTAYPSGIEPDFVSIDSFLTSMYSGSDAPFRRNPYAVTNPGYSKARFSDWQNPEGWPMYLVSRLDGPSAAIAVGLVDKAISAESTLTRSDGIGYFDYQHGPNNTVTDGTMLRAYQLAVQQGFRAVLNDQSVTGNMIHSAPQALWAWGWYSGPFDWDGYEFVNGAIGAQLTSYTANVIRYLGQGTWVPLWLNAGITATWGATGEPYTSGYANGDNLLNHFWNGYNFGESAYLASPVLNWMMLFVGDPLYEPQVFARAPSPPDPTPTLTFSAHQDGFTYSGPLTLSAAVQPSTVAVQFQANGYDIGPELTSPPYAARFGTNSDDNGPSLLTVKARDASGQVLISDPVPIIIFNDPSPHPPVISGVSAGSIEAASAVISWSTDTQSDSQVEYGLTDAYGMSSPLDGNLVLSHSVTLGGLAAGTVYHFRVKSRDASGQLSTSGDFTFTTTAVQGITASPSSGAGTTQAFTFTFPGVSSMWSVNVLIGSSLTAAGMCYFIYEAPPNHADLVDDAGATLLQTTPGSQGALANSQCSIPASSISVSMNGNTFTFSVEVTFSPAFSGPKTIWATWYDAGGQHADFQTIGSWTVP